MKIYLWKVILFVHEQQFQSNTGRHSRKFMAILRDTKANTVINVAVDTSRGASVTQTFTEPKVN